MINVLAGEINFARAGRLEAADHPHHGCLAASGRPDEDHELAFADCEADRVDDTDRAPVGSLELLGESTKLDEVGAAHRCVFEILNITKAC